VPLNIRVEVGGETVELRLGLSETTRLRPHEEISYPLFKELYDAVVDSGVFITPIVVDSSSGTVLDGTHRLAVAKSLGLRYVPTMLVDYEKRVVELRVWTKIFRGDVQRAISLLKNSGLSVEEDFRGGSHSCVIVSGELHVGLSGSGVADDRYYVFRKALKVLKEQFDEPTHMPEAQPKSDEFALIPPPTTKRDVVEAASSRNLLPPKTTRHVFAARIVEAPVAISTLASHLDQPDAEREFIRIISGMNVRALPGKTSYSGKYYDDEKLVVIG